MMKRFLKKALFVFGTLLAAGFSLVPFLWFVLSAFKTQTQVTAIPPQWLPSFSLEFFHSAIERYGILHYVLNSTIVAGSVTLVSISLGTLAGYALARLPSTMGTIYSHRDPCMRHVSTNCHCWTHLAFPEIHGMAQHLPGTHSSLRGPYAPPGCLDLGSLLPRNA